jgi:two-component system, chemotaxis family, CheB/CheR fusion protein
MIADLNGMLHDLRPREVEVQSTDGHWSKMRIIPNRTTDMRIDGAVLTFTSIDGQNPVQ